MFLLMALVLFYFNQTQIIKCNLVHLTRAFSTLKKIFHLYIDPTSHLIHYFLDNPRTFEELNTPVSQSIINKTHIGLPFKLFHFAFKKTYSHGHSGEKNSQKRHLTNFTISLNYHFGSQYSFMTVLIVKGINIFLFNVILLLLSQFTKMLLTSIIVSQWTQQVRSLPLHFCSY